MASSLPFPSLSPALTGHLSGRLRSWAAVCREPFRLRLRYQTRAPQRATPDTRPGPARVQRLEALWSALQKADLSLLFEAPAVHFDFLEAAPHPSAPAQPAPGPCLPAPFSRPCLTPSADPGAPSSRKPPGAGSACSTAAAPSGAHSWPPQLSPSSSKHLDPFYR